MADLHLDAAPEDPNAGGVLAQELFTALSDGVTVDIPVIDFDDEMFQIPDPVTGDEIEPLTEADLTSREVNGSGLFDGLMEAMSAHLTQEFTKNRITGAQYAEVYLGATSSALSSAVQYLLNRDTARWQAVLTQAQAKAAELAVIQARVAVEEAKVRYGIAKIEAQTTLAGYALTKMKLATESVGYDLAHVQVHQAEYTLDNMLPAQLATVVFQNEHLLPAQLDDIEAGISVKAAQESQILYETANVLPAQVQKIDADKALVEYQLEELLPAQVAGHTADTVGKEYSNEFLLPAQLANTREQTESHRAKTMNTRTDGTTTVAGAMGKQNDLYTQQITSYQRDAETKAVKMMWDTWITQKTMDEGLEPPTSVNNSALNDVLGTLLANLNLD